MDPHLSCGPIATCLYDLRIWPVTRQFSLADHVQVKSASFEDGLLRIELFREVPEAMKPRSIAINGTSPGNVQQIEAKAA